MDLSGMLVDQEPTESGDSISAFMSFAAAPRSPVDQVKWQGSQTGCHALNQLIKSSTDELPPGEASSRAGVAVNRGWQRFPSHELLADFSSSNDVGSSSTARSRPSSSSRSSSSSRMPPSRARLRDSRVPAPEPGTHSPLPLLDKTNPMQFLDILKGVSARLDENAGIQAKKDASAALAARAASRKRVRGSGITNLPEPGSSRRRCPPLEKREKTRLSAHRTHESFIIETGSTNDKGKGKAIEAEQITKIKGLALQGHSSLPDMASSSSGFEGTCDVDSSFMDVDSSFLTGSDSRSSMSTSFSETPSQAMMPPPTGRPTKSPFAVENQGRTTSTTSSEFLLPPQQQPQPSHRPPQIPPPVEVRPPKPEPVPKLHPLLSQKLPHPPVPAVAPAPVPQAPVAPRFFAKDTSPAPPSSSIPLCGSQSTRAPALGMRRTHTFPSKSVPAQKRQNGLPMRQRGFKPPLLSPGGAARQEASKQNRLAQIQASINSIEPMPDYRQAAAPILGQQSGSASSDSLRVCSSSSGSSSGSSNSFDSSTNGKVAVAAPPGAVDTDPDSSFGDMSFDMDALEETMRMYD